MKTAAGVMKTAATILCIILLQGCASFLSDGSQPVTVVTPHCPGAQCTLTNSKGTFLVEKTPATISIRKAYGDLQVNCTKGKDHNEQKFESSAIGSMYGNILLGGIIGGAIDAGTGKGFEYETRIENQLRCD